MVEVVAPLLQVPLVLPERVTVWPAHKERAPEALMVGATGLEILETTKGRLVAVQPFCWAVIV